LRPDEFWNLTLVEFMDLLDAFVFEERRQDDMKNQRVAWQTAHIMNSSGNYKKRIKVTDLYKPMDDRQEERVEQDVVKRFESPEEKEEYLKNLMSKFGKELNTDSSQ
jgi:hypothetical protein